MAVRWTSETDNGIVEVQLIDMKSGLSCNAQEARDGCGRGVGTRHATDSSGQLRQRSGGWSNSLFRSADDAGRM